MSGDFDSAKSLLKAALNAGSKDAGRWLAALNLSQGEFDAVIDILHSPDNPWEFALRGAAYLANAENALARQDLNRAIDGGGAPKLFAEFTFAFLKARQGNCADVLKLLTVECHKKIHPAWGYVARSKIHALLGDQASRLKDLSYAKRIEPSAWVYDEASNVFEELGDMQRSLEEADQAIRLSQQTTVQNPNGI
jgi:tetratricopeptide (TPR) repeat protein